MFFNKTMSVNSKFEEEDYLNFYRANLPSLPKITDKEALRLSIWFFNRILQVIKSEKYYGATYPYPYFSEIKKAIILEASIAYGPWFAAQFNLSTSMCPLCYYSFKIRGGGCMVCPAKDYWHKESKYITDQEAEPCTHNESPFSDVFYEEYDVLKSDQVPRLIEQTIKIFEKALYN